MIFLNVLNSAGSMSFWLCPDWRILHPSQKRKMSWNFVIQHPPPIIDIPLPSPSHSPPLSLPRCSLPPDLVCNHCSLPLSSVAVVIRRHSCCPPPPSLPLPHLLQSLATVSPCHFFSLSAILANSHQPLPLPPPFLFCDLATSRPPSSRLLSLSTLLVRGRASSSP